MPLEEVRRQQGRPDPVIGNLNSLYLYTRLSARESLSAVTDKARSLLHRETRPRPGAEPKRYKQGTRVIQWNTLFNGLRVLFVPHLGRPIE